MKQITQNLKKGSLTIEEVPVPVCKPNGILVKTHYSAVSVGTEKMKLKNADMNYLQIIYGQLLFNMKKMVIISHLILEHLAEIFL